MAATAYAQIADVQALFTHIIFTTDSKPTVVEIEEWLEQYYAKINGLLSTKGISVPISSATSPASYDIVKNMNLCAAAALTAEVVYYGDEPSESRQAHDLWKEYHDTLLEIRRNSHYLYDATFMRHVASSFQTDNPSKDHGPIFTMDDEL